jgi:Ca2+-binding EF-hand superfamily protein
MDANRDGRIEGDEVPAAYRRVFDQLLRPGDGDKNGLLDQRELAQNAPRLSIIAQMAANRMGLDIEAELEKIPTEQLAAMDQMDAYARPMDLLADPAQAEQLFRRLDANGDKQLTPEEAPGQFAPRFEEMIRRGDADGDQRLSRREFLAVTRRLAEFESVKPDRAAVERVRRQLRRRFDADGDGALTVREAPQRIAESFDRADLDANGRLDRSELSRVAETMARMQALGRGQLSRPAATDDSPSKQAGGKKPAKKSRRPRPF